MISVVICTYNRCGSLKRTLESIGAMSIPEGLACEVIVVDNNSTDDTRRVVETFSSLSRLRVRYFLERNQGLSYARNRGIKESRGEIISFIDDDVTVAENWLKNIQDAFAEHDVAALGGKILPEFQAPAPAWLLPELRFVVGILDRGDAREYLTSPKEIWGANFTVKRAMFTRYGVFDTRLGRKGNKLYTGEEAEFFGRLLANSERLLYDPTLVVWHRIPASHLTKRYFRKRHFDIGELQGRMPLRQPSREMFGIPFWIIRMGLTAACRYGLGAAVRRVTAFREQLVMVYCIGFIQSKLRFGWKSEP